MKEVFDFLLSQWVYVLAVCAVIYLLLSQDDDLPENNVSPQELVHLINKGGVTLFDLRAQDAYRSAHIKDARSLGQSASMSDLAKLLKHNRDMVFICHDGRLSSKIASQVKARSRMNIYVLAGGMNAWQEARFPIDVDAENLS